MNNLNSIIHFETNFSYLVSGTFSKGFKGAHRHSYCRRNCQSIKRNIHPQIRLSSFRRISPHFALALHINNISCSFRLFLSIYCFPPTLLHSSSLHSRHIDFVSYLTFLRCFHLSSFHLFFYFLQSIIQTSHPLEHLRTSYPNPLYPSRLF